MEAKKSPSAEVSWGLSSGDDKADSHLALISEAILHVDEKKH